MQKIFVWCAQMYEGRADVEGFAMSEDGRYICGHVSSSPAWSHRDMITSGWKDEYYKATCPDGYEVVWLGDDPEPNADWQQAFALNKQAREANETPA